MNKKKMEKKRPTLSPEQAFTSVGLPAIFCFLSDFDGKKSEGKSNFELNTLG